MSKPSNDKNTVLLTLAAIIIIGEMGGFGYQMYEHNKRVTELASSIDIPDNKLLAGEWIKYDVSNPCPILVEQRFDSNKSHYMCMYIK